jgi:hypothetical protein
VFRAAVVLKFGAAAEDGETSAVGRCDPERWVCLSVQGCTNFIAAGEFGFKIGLNMVLDLQ